MSKDSRNQGICYVVGAGENYGLDFVPEQGDYVIAVDGGYEYLEQAGIVIDMAVGDFDSLRQRPRHANVISLNAEKDDTDMRAAVWEGLRRGYGMFHIYGGTGGRMDHTIANMQLLAELSQKGKQGFLFGRDCVMTALTNGELLFPEGIWGYVSVFAHSDQAVGVTLSGLKYPLKDAVLKNTYSLGVSNELRGQKSKISVEKGTLLISYPIEAGVPAIIGIGEGESGHGDE